LGRSSAIATPEVGLQLDEWLAADCGQTDGVIWANNRFTPTGTPTLRFGMAAG
jgi:hypothetical protein